MQVCYFLETKLNPNHAPNSTTIAGVAALGNMIYVVGGYDGERQLNTVERYNTETNVWEFAAPMREARSALSVTVLDGKLYAMGKFNLCVKCTY